MKTKEVRHCIYKYKKDIFEKVLIFLRIYRITDIKFISEKEGSNEIISIYVYTVRFVLYNPLTWFYLIFVIFLQGLLLFLTDFIKPLLEAFINLPKDILTFETRKNIMIKESINNDEEL